MAFHFKKTELPAKAVRRVCRERIDAALEELRRGKGHGAVHEVRREIKKLRAIFKLVRIEISPEVYRKGSRALRKAAGTLTGPRDAYATLGTFKKLAGRAAHRFGGIEKALHKNCRREMRLYRRKGSGTTAGRILKKTERRVDELKIRAIGWGAIEPGLELCYHGCQESFQLARKHPTAENLHDLRKKAKDLWYYFRLLCPAWPAELRRMMEELEKLGAILGEDHDLVMLKEFAAKFCAGEPKETGALNRMIAARRKKLCAAALKLGARLFVDTPTALSLRLGNHWNVWRDGARAK